MYAIRSYYALLSILFTTLLGALMYRFVLLRVRGQALSEVIATFGVITSYSIHYTKLYEVVQFRRSNLHNLPKTRKIAFCPKQMVIFSTNLLMYVFFGVFLIVLSRTLYDLV